MSEKQCHLPPIHSLPLRKRLVHGEFLKKGPLKKVYATDHHGKLLSQSNPLLCTPSQPLKKCIGTPSTTTQPKKRLSLSKNSRKRSTDGKLYCHCRQPYDATRFMIACDKCDEWFHGECIHINEKEGELIDLYFCIQCSQGASLGHVSKYCSDSCGLQVARARLTWAEMKRRRHTEDDSTRSETIVQLCLKRQRASRMHSLADAEDRARLPKIRCAKRKVRDTVGRIDAQLKALSERESWCGFQHDNGSVCKQENRCEKHGDWQERLCEEYKLEKQEQFKILLALEKEWQQVKERIRRRRNEKEILHDLVNETLCV
ncbi:hypothetical protein INT47_004884 [Mucor saturninus]|uniref:PHD-type domain-containing protein n=1 Tax=Mucor saturninus TaxID=64648 RepID=A0A8H7US53_9FUNG|nr:hypothetical protein INT47_004884 [Mucor saturninus]